LSLNNNIISGSPTANDVGDVAFEVQASNATGDSTPQTVTVTVALPPIPVVNSPDTATGTVGLDFVYQITTELDNATSYSETGLPAWASLNNTTGEVTGIPDAAGDFTFEVTATNAAGDSNPLEVDVSISIPAPAIVSANTASGQVGQAFTYTIQTDVPALGYTATSLPAGLSRTGATISGTPTQSGVFETKISAYNATGSSGTFLLTITVNQSDGNPPALEITSPTEATEVPGALFTYQITATPRATSFVAYGIGTGSDLPDLSLPPDGSVISGSLPTTPGEYDIVLVANYGENPGDPKATSTLRITIAGVPELSIAFVEPTSDLIVGSISNLPVDFIVNASTGVGSITSVELIQNGTAVQTLTTPPYEFAQAFSQPGVYQMRAVVTNSVGATATTDNITVTVEPLNPVVRDADFIVQTFDDLYYRTPSTTELNNGLSFLANGGSRGEYVVQLMTTLLDQLSLTATLQIYRTAGGYWPDYTTLSTQWVNYQNAIDGGAYANTLAQVFRAKFPNIVIPITDPQDPQDPDNIDYDAWQNELDFLNALYINKYGSSADSLGLTFSLNTLALAFYNSLDGGGDMVANFATTNRLSGAYGPSGYPLSVAIENTQDTDTIIPAEQYGFEIPNTRFPDRVRASQLISGLLREQPTDNQVTEMGRSVARDFAGTVQDILESPEYADRFTATYQLAVTTQTGGSVTIDPSQENPLNPSIYEYTEGTNVTLSATPNAGYEFTGWTGTVASNQATIVVTMTTNVAVTANFRFIPTTASVVAEVMAANGVTNPAAIAPDVDYDGDGYSNAVEVALGSNPTQAASEPVMDITPGAGEIYVEYIRLMADEIPDDMVMVTEYSDTMAPGSWVSVGDASITTAGVSQVGVPEGYERVRATVPMANGRAFVNRRVEIIIVN
ncbi:MAG: putative Ig domain-containing protein, partial [Puniceicoccales bacterium]